MCEKKSGPVWLADSALVAVMRAMGEGGGLCETHGVPRWYDDAEKLIRDPEVDAVYVATPPGSHLEYRARRGGGKPCYVEEADVRSHGECRRMIEAFEPRSCRSLSRIPRALPRFVKTERS